MSFYLESRNKIDCFNCTACATACPRKCITMKNDDNDGYIYPHINREECISCGKCKNVCINLNSDKLQNEIKEAYVLYSKDSKTRITSSSGGISSILMEYTIYNNGVVYGVSYNKELIATHTRATTIEECKLFRGSKYVRSNIINIFDTVVNDLKNGKLVLFTGTPCQVAALKSIVNKELQNKLILCEIMCDSVASPMLFQKFKAEVEKKYSKKIKDINFRSKVNGAHNKSMEIQFLDGSNEILESRLNNLYSEYMQIFGCGLSAPMSCQNCKFEYINKRTSDFTIGDYWGKEKILEDDNKGISLMLINTQKAKNIFEGYIKDKVTYKEVKIMQALDNNHISNKRNILNKEQFMSDFEKSTFDELAKKYVRKYRWRTKLGKMIPKNLKEKIKIIISR